LAQGELSSGGVKVLGFRENLENLLKARFPLIYIESYEEQRVLAEITAVVADKDRLRTPRKLYPIAKHSLDRPINVVAQSRWGGLNG
jgi:hypothetical protein